MFMRCFGKCFTRTVGRSRSSFYQSPEAAGAWSTDAACTSLRGLVLTMQGPPLGLDPFLLWAPVFSLCFGHRRVLLPRNCRVEKGAQNHHLNLQFWASLVFQGPFCDIACGRRNMTFGPHGWLRSFINENNAHLLKVSRVPKWGP